MLIDLTKVCGAIKIQIEREREKVRIYFRDTVIIASLIAITRQIMEDDRALCIIYIGLIKVTKLRRGILCKGNSAVPHYHKMDKHRFVKRYSNEATILIYSLVEREAFDLISETQNDGIILLRRITKTDAHGAFDELGLLCSFFWQFNQKYIRANRANFRSKIAVSSRAKQARRSTIPFLIETRDRSERIALRIYMTPV